jgi:peptidyl-prolyl cis-trans isomerase A (cyclophilin A)
VNKRWSQQTISDDPPKVPNKTGTIVFAKSGQPDSRTTQLFINLRDNSTSLDHQGFTPFGEVIQGMENVMNFYTGYGEGQPNGAGPSQATLEQAGNSYLEQNFPKLDYIKSARIVP